MAGRRRPNKEKKGAMPKNVPPKALPKPYLRVPDDFEAQLVDKTGKKLPDSEELLKKHLFNQSKVSGW